MSIKEVYLNEIYQYIINDNIIGFNFFIKKNELTYNSIMYSLLEKKDIYLLIILLENNFIPISYYTSTFIFQLMTIGDKKNIFSLLEKIILNDNFDLNILSQDTKVYLVYDYLKKTDFCIKILNNIKYKLSTNTCNELILYLYEKNINIKLYKYIIFNFNISITILNNIINNNIKNNELYFFTKRILKMRYVYS